MKNAELARNITAVPAGNFQSCSLLVSDEGVPGLLGVALPLPGDVGRDWVGGVQRDGLPRVVAQGAEHGLEVRDIALQGEQSHVNQAAAVNTSLGEAIVMVNIVNRAHIMLVWASARP